METLNNRSNNQEAMQERDDVSSAHGQETKQKGRRVKAVKTGFS